MITRLEIARYIANQAHWWYNAPNAQQFRQQLVNDLNQPNLQANLAINVIEAALGVVDEKCAQSIQKYRVRDWTAWVQDDPGKGNRKRHNFGINDEWSFRCGGCMRYTPINMLTADHKIPKSDNTALMLKIRKDWDEITNVQWDVYIGLSPNATRNLTHQDRTALGNITASIELGSRGTYTKTGVGKGSIAYDYRNFLAMCSKCNTNKSNKTYDENLVKNGNGGYTPAQR